MRYIIYLRVSTDRQDVEMQNHHANNYINLVNEGSEVITFSDPETSSRTPMANRQGLQAMLKGLKKGDVIVTFKLDRLSRDIIEMVTIHRLIESRGCKIYSIGEPNIESWMLGIFGSLAQKERENISQRTKAALASKKAKGERLGHVPYGHRANNKGFLEVDISEAEILKRMYNLRLEGMTFRQIAETLNNEGHCNREESPWTHGATSRVYKNYLAVCEAVPVS